MGGSSDGGGGRTPYEAPDSLRSAQCLRAIGLISLGPIKGSVDKWKSTYFDNTPIQNEDGSYNFKNTDIQFTLGTQDQLPLKGFEKSEREVPVSTEIKHAHPLTRSVIDPDVDSIRLTLGVNALFEQNDQGDTNGTSVSFEVLINGQSRKIYSINGKSSSRFYRSYLINNLPPKPFTITVKRTTPDSKSQRLQNGTTWVSYTEIINTRLSYPNMAIVGIKTDSRYNPNFPNINFLLYGRIVKVPSNYNPEDRTYTGGLWKGDFKNAWTNNPAWVFYDLVTNRLAGLGQRISDYGLDKFQLYQIAQYCDQLVPDGYGGEEPRMVANLWLTEQRNAYDVIADMASVFRAIVVWNGTQLSAVQDRPTDPVYSYNTSNVIDGKFTRQYAPLKSIYTAVEVEYADERNMYQKAIEYVADDAMIARYGYNVKKIVAFACTSRGQAKRYGKWVLETSRLEQCTITFNVGREGLRHLPGDIIEVADNYFAGTNLAGRVLAVDGRKITLDRPIELQANSYFSYIDSNQQQIRLKIQSVDPTNSAIITLDSVPKNISEDSAWALQTPIVSTQLYRAIGVTENEKDSYTITALQHEPQKQAIVDNGAVFEPVAESLHNLPQVQDIHIQFNENRASISAYVTGGEGSVKYDIRIYKDGNLYRIELGKTNPEIELDDLPDGEYSVVVLVRSAQGVLLSEKTQTFVISRPPVPQNVNVIGGLSDITISWDYVDDITQTEIWVSEQDDIKTAKRVAKVLANIYSHNVGARQTRYYWVRHTRGQNIGAFYQETGLSATTGADIDAELAVLNEKLSKNIIDEVFDVAAPARKLELIKTVDELDVDKFLEVKNVYNQQDGKLYTWDGTKYTTKVPFGDIEGVIPKSQLDESLLNELTNNTQAIKDESLARTNAIRDESVNRTKAIQAESTKITALIQAEASTRGTAITALQNVDKQQAQQISTVTAKADNALSGLQAEQTARIEGDKAEATARNALTARVATAESGITSLQRSVSEQGSALTETSKNLTAKIDGMSVGGRNYLLNSKIDYTGNRYSLSFRLAKIPVLNEIVTVTLWGALAEDRQAFAVYNTHGFRELAKLSKIRDGVYSATFAWNQPLEVATEKDNSMSISLNLYAYPRSATSNNTINCMKLEVGSLSTDWTPAPEDADANIANVQANLTTYQSAQAEIDKAQSTQLNGLNARIGSAESSISNIQATTASKTEVASIAQSMLQAEFGKMSVGGRNYLLNSKDDVVVTAPYRYKVYHSALMEITEPVVFSALIKDIVGNNGNKVTVGIFDKVNINTTLEQRRDVPIINGKIIVKFSRPSSSTKTSIVVYANSGSYSGSTTGSVTYYNAKLEIGTVATDWTPAPEDIEQSIATTSAKIDTVQETLAKADKANADQITAITARVGNAEGNISTTSQTLATLSGEVKATHTIKTQAIAGGRTAIAGIAIGTNADNKTAESSVIVMADKFQVVKNAQDGLPKSMLTVVNNQVAINGDLIANGAITARMMATDSVEAGAIKAGAIKADHLAAGQVSAEHFVSGLGGNLLTNPIFANVVNGKPHFWEVVHGEDAFATVNTDRNYGLRSMGLPNENCMCIAMTRTNEANQMASMMQFVPINCGQWYIASVYIGSHNAEKCELGIGYLDADGIAIDSKAQTAISAGKEFNGLGDAERLFIKFQAPDNCESIMFYLSLSGITAGKSSAIMLVARPMLERCTQYATQPSEWVNAGITSIHGGSIESETILAKHIGAGEITTNHMTAGSIDAKVLKAGTVNTNHLTAKAITADKMNVATLSAVSANLGTVTAGTIKGLAISGNTITGGTISGTNITGGIIKGSRLEGATGSFSGELEVKTLIGGGIIEVVTGLFKKTNRTKKIIPPGYGPSVSYEVDIYEANITINPAPVDRWIIGIPENSGLLLPKNQGKNYKIERDGGNTWTSYSSDTPGWQRREEKRPPANTVITILAYAVSTNKYISIN
ncbi:hypothetical protein BMT54_06545 [Pasteurellaceae bacterium 15-036681]|nr:hypothetical protein BMT54_06545 [Pasteurellaceae bacterium 15-036681]